MLDIKDITNFLDIAHNDGVQGNRLTAIETLTLLPLSDEAWKETAFEASDLLRKIPESRPEFKDAVRVFARIPVHSIRQALRGIARKPGHPASFVCAVELAQRRDAAGLERLLAELEGSNAREAAERLACLPIENLGVAREPFTGALSSDDSMVRFWSTVALARLDEVAPLEKLWNELLSGEGELPPIFYGNPWTPYNALSATRPLPGKLQRFLTGLYEDTLKRVRSEGWPDAKLPGDANILIGGLTGIVDEYGRPAVDAREASPTPPTPVERTKADAVAERLLKHPFDEQLNVNADWKDMSYLSLIGPENAGKLMMVALDDLDKKTRDRPEPAPLYDIMSGNAMLELAAALPKPIRLPLWELVENFEKKWPNLPSGPLMWVLARAGAKTLVNELGPRISAAEPSNRAKLLSLTRNLSLQLNGPAPFAGAGPGGEGAPPPMETLIMDEYQMSMAEPPEPKMKPAAPPPMEMLNEYEMSMAEPPEFEVGAVPPEAEAQPRYQDPRYIQKKLKRLDGSAEADEPPAWVGGVAHHLKVRIGPPEEGWEDPKNLVTFPYELLPPADEHCLSVVLSEPDHLESPLVRKVVLKRTGPSSEAEFFLTPRADRKGFQARIVVSYKNRILQTALLTGRIVDDISQAAPDDRIELEVAVVRPTFHELEGRTPYSLALAVNHGADGEPRLMELSDEYAVIRGLAQQQGKISAISACLSMIAQDAKRYKNGLKSPDGIKVLNILADKGRALYDFLVRDQLGNRYRTGGPIQIVNLTPDAYFPAEFIYEFAMPKEGASLCPEAEKAFTKLDFSKICNKEDHASPEHPYVCPFGFWGLRRVIERHACLPKGCEKISGDFVLQAEPAEGRNSVELQGNAILGVSAQVEKELKGAVNSLFDEIKKISSIPVSHVPDWQNWLDQVKSLSPSLIVSLPHAEEKTEFNDTKYYLEIGGELKEARRIGETKAHYVRPHEDAPAPVVFLLGCNTTVPSTPIESIVGHFRRAGAAIVVSTVSSVLGSHASKVTLELLKAMFRETSGNPRPVGELIRDVRRRCLGSGTLMALCVVAFGDADWRIHTAGKIGGGHV